MKSAPRQHQRTGGAVMGASQHAQKAVRGLGHQKVMPLSAKMQKFLLKCQLHGVFLRVRSILYWFLPVFEPAAAAPGAIKEP